MLIMQGVNLAGEKLASTFAQSKSVLSNIAKGFQAGIDGIRQPRDETRSRLQAMSDRGLGQQSAGPGPPKGQATTLGRTKDMGKAAGAGARAADSGRGGPPQEDLQPAAKKGRK